MDEDTRHIPEAATFRLKGLKHKIIEAQSQQMLGQVSPQIDRVASEMQGWGGLPAGPGLPATRPTTETPETMAGELEDATDFSRRDVHCNLLAMSWQAGLGPFTPPPPMAGYHEPPMAATSVTPINQFNPSPES